MPHPPSISVVVPVKDEEESLRPLHAEIAAALQLRPASVRVLLFRARQAVARRLEAHGLGKRGGS